MGSGKELGRDTIVVIITLYKEGYKCKDIATRVGIGVRQVQKWTKKFRDGGGDAIPTPKPRSGRPRKITNRTSKVIRRQLDKNPTLTARKLKESNPSLLQDVSVRCISDHLLKDLQYRSCCAKVLPLLSAKNMRDRIAFCKKYKDWTLEDWDQVLWSDESTFVVSSGCRSKRVRRPRGSDPNDPRYTAKVVKHAPSVMVWGCFAFGGVGNLVFLEKNESINQHSYFELLCDNLPESFEKCNASWFMQDGAPAHTARSVTQWLVDCGVNYFKKWPGNSPDLNPIEHVWHIIKKQLQDRDASTVAKLKIEIQDIWDTIIPNHVEKLARSIPARLEKVIKLKGKSLGK